MTAVPADPRRTSRLKVAQARGYRAAAAFSLSCLLLVGVLGRAAPSERTDPAGERDPEPLHVLTHTGEVYTVSLSPDGKTVATATNREARVWDLATGVEIACFRGHPVNLYGLAFTPDSRHVASAGGMLLKIWDARTGQETRTYRGLANHFFFRIAFSPDGKRLAASAGAGNRLSGAVTVWDVTTGKEALLLQGHADPILTVAFSPHGKQLASASGATSGGKPGEVKVWDATGGKELLALRGHQTNIYGVAFSPDGRYLVSAGGIKGVVRPGEIKVWDLLTGGEVFSLGGHTGAVYGVAYSPDGRHLATASEDKTIRVWDVVTGREALHVTAHTGPVYSLAYCRDGRRLVSASGDRTVKVWDLNDRLRTGGTPPLPLLAADMDRLWGELAGNDVAKAYHAARTLGATPGQTVPYMRLYLRPGAAADESLQARIRQLVLDLDDNRFVVREQATEELAKLGDSAGPALRRILAGQPSLEVRRRVESLLEKLDRVALSPERLRACRAVAVLEHLATPEAKQLLESLAGGPAEARLTQEVKASLARLAGQAGNKP